MTGTSDKLESFLSSIRETCNIVEMVRSGVIGLSRSEKIVISYLQKNEGRIKRLFYNRNE
ncbi:hypothetical protein [Gilliamella apicola]|uniref:hypothetical protein n=1 Tax=Gilliamella apicola TaxID=1196095 RepID=UPI003AAD008C